ncbi:MAG TPA: sulfite exporter TauE/SafE family protein [Thermoleophilia bacterium]|nr:sulfite exporter TauE/SafE family protein [Thermoleophilia bacterium]
MTFFVLVAVAVIVGILGSLLGVGGGILIVPILTLFLDVPVKNAVGTSLVCVVVTSSASQLVYVARGLTNSRLGMTLEVATTLGALVGGVTAILVSGRAIFGVFAAVLVYVLISMERKPAEPLPASPGSALAGSFPDPDTGRTITYGVDHLSAGLALSFVAGNVSGLLGVGGGAIKVPVMALLMRVPLRAAIATSNLMIGVTAATGALLFFGRGLIEPRYAVPTALGIVIGAQLGPRLSSRVSTGVLRRVFEVLLAVLAVQMALKAVGI